MEHLLYIRFWQMYYVTVVTFDLEFCEIFLPSQKPFYCLTQAHWWCNGPLQNEIDKQTKNFSEERDSNALPISACFSLLIISSGICSIWWFIVFLTYDILQESKLWLMIFADKKFDQKKRRRPACKSGSMVAQVQFLQFRASLDADGQTLPCTWNPS